MPLRRKEASYTAKALDHVIAELGIPTSIATDQGTEFQQQFAAKLRYYDIKHLVLRTYAVFVERAIGTLKNRILMRQRAFPKPWPVFLDEVVKLDPKSHDARGAKRGRGHRRRGARRAAGAREKPEDLRGLEHRRHREGGPKSEA